jgi:hypothetical protein
MARLYQSVNRPDEAAALAGQAIDGAADPTMPDGAGERSLFLQARSLLHSLLKQPIPARRDALERLALVEESAGHTRLDLVNPLIGLAQCALEAEELDVCESALDRVSAIVDEAPELDRSVSIEVLFLRRACVSAKAAQRGGGRDSFLPKEADEQLKEIEESINQLGGARLLLESLARNASVIRDRLGPNDLRYTVVLARLAAQYMKTGEYARVVEVGQQSLAIVAALADDQAREPVMATVLALLVTAADVLEDSQAADGWATRLEALLRSSESLSWDARLNGRLALAQRAVRRDDWRFADRVYADVAKTLLDAPPSPATNRLQRNLELIQAIVQAQVAVEPDARWEALAPRAFATLGRTDILTQLAQEQLCKYLERTGQYARLCEARSLHASLVYAAGHWSDLYTRYAIREAAGAWRRVGQLVEAARWYAKALRGLQSTEETCGWWSRLAIEASFVQLRCGNLIEAERLARAVLALPAAWGLPLHYQLEALGACARVALASGALPACAEAVQEIDRRLAAVDPEVGHSADWHRPLALVHALRGHGKETRQEATRARAAAAGVGPELAEFIAAEMALLEILAAYKAAQPLPPETTLERIDDCLRAVRQGRSMGEVLLGEYLLRMGGPVATMGDRERAVAMIRQGLDILSATCGDFHPEIGAARMELVHLLSGRPLAELPRHVSSDTGPRSYDRSMHLKGKFLLNDEGHLAFVLRRPDETPELSLVRYSRADHTVTVTLTTGVLRTFREPILPPLRDAFERENRMLVAILAEDESVVAEYTVPLFAT